jgi:hypothetical protein
MRTGEADPLASDSAAGKMANRVYNAARWGSWVANASGMAAANIPSQRGINEATLKDGFGRLIQLTPRG